MGPFEDPTDAVRRDVLRNLGNVLNARRGRLVAQPDYGLDDYEDLARTPAKVAQTIRQQILRFEPRLDPERLQVAFSKSDTPRDSFDGTFRAHFIVTGRLILPSGEMRPIRIQTTVLSEASQVETSLTHDEMQSSGPTRPWRVLVETEEST